jgi:hypothetical protein
LAICALQALRPIKKISSVWELPRRFCAKSSPNLTTVRDVVVEQANPAPRFRSDGRSRYPAGAGPHYNHIEASGHPVTTSVSGVQTTWHVRRWSTPFTVARHSMQIPIPHNGARASCRTEILQDSLAIIMAAATLVPSATQAARPLIVIWIFSLI